MVNALTAFIVKTSFPLLYFFRRARYFHILNFPTVVFFPRSAYRKIWKVLSICKKFFFSYSAIFEGRFEILFYMLQEMLHLKHFIQINSYELQEGKFWMSWVFCGSSYWHVFILWRHSEGFTRSVVTTRAYLSYTNLFLNWKISKYDFSKIEIMNLFFRSRIGVCVCAFCSTPSDAENANS